MTAPDATPAIAGSPRGARLGRLAFVLLAPALLAEVGSGNTSLAAFADAHAVLFLTIAYGVPLLVVAELRTRLRLSSLAVFLLGLAYGLFNEGLLAQTLVRAEGVPISAFDHYMVAAGFNWSWAALILPWHALFSVSFPLALADAAFPAAAGAPLLPRSTDAAVGIVLAAGIVLLAAGRQPEPQMALCAAAIAVLLLAAVALREPAAAPPPRRRAAQAAFAFVAYPAVVVASAALGAANVQPPLYVLWCLAAAAGLVLIARRLGATLLSAPLTACGAYAALGVFHAVGSLSKGALAEAAVGVVFALAFVAAAVGALRRRVAVTPA